MTVDPSRARLLKMVVLCAALGALVLFFGRDVDWKSWLGRGLDMLRVAGPTAFFLCMAILPALGAPLSLFTLTAASAFGPQLGMFAVTGLSLAAIAANIGLGYVLASRVMRPVLEFLMKRLGYRLPEVDSTDATHLILLLRVTPGLPFPVQNYLLGMARVPFLRYLALSCLISFPISAAFLFLGDALMQGRGRMALLGVMLLMATLVAIQYLRRRLNARQRGRP